MKTKLSDRETIKTHQRAWATRTGLAYDADGYCMCANDNIFQGLSPEARKEFESEFTEPYSKSKLKTFLKPKYFDKDRTLWATAGLPGCQSIADALRVERHDFKVLDVAHLLKHMLALANNF